MPTAIPDRTTKKWSQPNSSEILGTIQRTRSMDFDLEGYCRLAKRARCVYAETDDSDFKRPTAIEMYSTTGEYFIMTVGHMFKMTFSDVLTVADQSAVSNIPTMDSSGRCDMVNWQGYLYANGDGSSSGDLVRYNGSWSTAQYDLAVGGPMAVFASKNYLAIGQGNTVLLLDTSHVLKVTLTIGSEFYITSLDFSNGYLYIGTRHIYGGEAMLFQWDGNTAVANNAWPVGTHRINSVKKYRTSVALITSDGSLLQFNGAGFTALANLPIYFTDFDWDLSGNSTMGRVIHRGMVVDNDIIFINISPRLFITNRDQTGYQYFNSFPGGVMCYDPKVGLYHRYPQSSSERLVSDAVTTGNVNTSTEVVTIAGVTVPETGTPVIYSNEGSTSIAGIVSGSKYYVINLSSTTMKLATTRALALAGTAIDLTGTGNNSQRFFFVPNRDFGATHSIGTDSTGGGSSCAIAILRPTSAALILSSTGRRIIFGGVVGQNTITEKAVLNLGAAGQENRGYIITARLPSSAVKDSFRDFTIKWKGIKTVEDKIIVKNRIIERTDNLNKINQALNMTGTWVSGTQFTSTADLSAARVGDEVEIVNGSGAGYLAHITVISVNAGTYTVTIDETVQGIAASDTFLFFIENWVKNSDSTISTADNDSYQNTNNDVDAASGGAKSFSINKHAKWLEIKLELRGEDVIIEEIFINNIPIRDFM